MAINSVRMTTAEATVRTLIVNGIDTVFALPGVQNDFLFDALHGAQGKIRTLHTRHEQGAAYMALGAALATGKPAAYAVVPGPGILNTGAALSTAYACNAPVLALTGQIPSHHIGRALGMLHEIPDQLGYLRSLTKWAERIRSPQEAPALVSEAFRQLRSGRPRPVALECPLDVWPRNAPVELPTAPAAPRTIALDTDAITEAAKLLGAAERPLIVVGGGAMEAGAELAEIAERLQAPVVANRMGKGALDARHPFSVGAYLGFKLWPEADVVLAVGTRLQLQLMQWGSGGGLKVVRIDADPEEIGRIERPAVGILGDAAEALRALAAELPRYDRPRTARAAEMIERKAAETKELADHFAPQIGWLDAIRAELPENGIFVDEVTQIGYLGRLAFPIYRPRTYLTPSYQGTLGWGVATAIGAKAARPDLPLVAISGDGGFMFNVQELASAAQHRIPVVFVLMNDGAFGNVRRFQVEAFGNRLIASDLKNPDFLKLADSFGIMGLSAASPAELRVQLRKALAAGEPALIEVKVGPMPSPWNILRFQRRARPA
ncbi:MAG TPA: thiamine pyrophosphate-dependent enzyme [Stellaceae bacterium]|nr:thiamine pyrophosphate-dependent enzyme [Stellaceae bacterium]